MVLSIFGRKVALKGEYGRDAQPKDRQFGVVAFAAVQSFLRVLIDTHPMKVMPGAGRGSWGELTPYAVRLCLARS